MEPTPPLVVAASVLSTVPLHPVATGGPAGCFCAPQELACRSSDGDQGNNTRCRILIPARIFRKQYSFDPAPPEQQPEQQWSSSCSIPVMDAFDP
jgi:hypothetical protein